MGDLRELYQELILDHNQNPQNFGELDGATATADGFNPLCGDRLTLYLRLLSIMQVWTKVLHSQMW